MDKIVEEMMVPVTARLKEKHVIQSIEYHRDVARAKDVCIILTREGYKKQGGLNES